DRDVLAAGKAVGSGEQPADRWTHAKHRKEGRLDASGEDSSGLRAAVDLRIARVEKRDGLEGRARRPYIEQFRNHRRCDPPSAAANGIVQGNETARIGKRQRPEQRGVE